MKYPMQLRTKVSVEDFDAINRNAASAGLSVCAYLRECATRRQVTSTVDARTFALLNKIGGMVSQLWKEGRGVEASQIERGLDNLRASIERAQAGGGNGR